MSIKVLSSTVLVTLLIFSSFTVEASNSQTVIVSDDACVEAYVPLENFGHDPYLKVAESDAWLTFAFLMFNLSGISYAFNASSEIKLRLHVFNVTSPHIIGVHWCLNNTWDESNLTFESQHMFSISTVHPWGSVVSVSSNNTWYEWTVTDIVYDAMQENSDRLTLVLQVEAYDSSNENDYVLFDSKDQNLAANVPQLLFSYKSPTTNPTGIITLTILVSVVVVGIIVFATYKSSKKRRKGKYYRKPRLQQKSVKRH